MNSKRKLLIGGLAAFLLGVPLTQQAHAGIGTFGLVGTILEAVAAIVFASVEAS